MASRSVQEMEVLLRARYPVIYVVTWEEGRVEEALAQIARRREKKLYLWSVARGLQQWGTPLESKRRVDERTTDPQVALDHVLDSMENAVYVFRDLHPFFNSPAITRRVRELAAYLKNSYKTLVIVGPTLCLPPELQKDVTVVEFDLPDRDDLGALLDRTLAEVNESTGRRLEVAPAARDRILGAASGLTLGEAENVFAKTLVVSGRLSDEDLPIILSEKEQTIRKSGLLEYYHADASLQQIGGMDVLKDWLGKRSVAFDAEAARFGLPAPKGVLLIGVQGCGKSLLAKAVAGFWGLPLLRLDVGRLFGSLVGSSEENVRNAIRVAESVAPCVAGETRVVLADGSERTIQSLYDEPPTDLSVLSMTDDYRLTPSRVRAVTRRAAPDLFHVRLMHAELRATGNHLHPVMRDGELVWVRSDSLQVGDHIAMPRTIPTAPELPPLRRFLPAGTRLYFDGALPLAREEVRTRQRRYAVRARGADYVRLEELRDPSLPPFALVERFVSGRGGRTDSVLRRLPERLTADIGYLLGLVASDGYLTHGSVGFVNTEAELHRRFAELVERCFGIVPACRLNDHPGKGSRLAGTTLNSVFRPCHASRADNVLLCAILRNIQTDLLTLPPCFLRAWLRGFFDGDGSVTDPAEADPKVVLTSKVTTMNATVRSVLHRVGFPTSNPGCRNIEISGLANVQRFVREIGSDHPGRSCRMRAWRQVQTVAPGKDRTDVIPIGARLRRARLSVGMGTADFQATPASLVSNYERGVRHPSRVRLAGMAAEMRDWAQANGAPSGELEALDRLLDAPVGWSHVRKVTPEAPPEFVYDLACDAPHTFIANGLVTHNCVLWVDEIEKSMAGSQSSGQTDGGTSARVLSSFLTWLQEKTAPVFVVATANSIESLPPELLRRGRLDETFFVDLPDAHERREIFHIHLEKRGRAAAGFDTLALAEATEGFSGAEIEQCVIAGLFDAYSERGELTTEILLRAAGASVPLSRTMKEPIDRLREWADGRARRASTGMVTAVQSLVTGGRKLELEG